MNTLWGWGRASWAGCGPDVRRGGQTLIMGYSADKSPLIGHLAGPPPAAGATGSTASGEVRAKPPHPHRVFMQQRHEASRRGHPRARARRLGIDYAQPGRRPLTLSPGGTVQPKRSTCSSPTGFNAAGNSTLSLGRVGLRRTAGRVGYCQVEANGSTDDHAGAVGPIARHHGVTPTI